MLQVVIVPETVPDTCFSNYYVCSSEKREGCADTYALCRQHERDSNAVFFLLFVVFMVVFSVGLWLANRHLDGEWPFR